MYLMNESFSSYLALMKELLNKRSRNIISDAEDEIILEKLDEYWFQLRDEEITILERAVKDLNEYKVYVEPLLKKQNHEYLLYPPKFSRKYNFNHLKLVMSLPGEEKASLDKQLRYEDNIAKNILNIIKKHFKTVTSPTVDKYVMGHAASWGSLIFDFKSNDLASEIGDINGIKEFIFHEKEFHEKELIFCKNLSINYEKIIRKSKNKIYMNPLLACIYMIGMVKRYNNNINKLKCLAFSDVMCGESVASGSDMYEELSSFERSPERVYTAILIAESLYRDTKQINISIHSTGEVLGYNTFKLGLYDY
jgi:hypothetical protein